MGNDFSLHEVYHLKSLPVNINGNCFFTGCACTSKIDTTRAGNLPGLYVRAEQSEKPKYLLSNPMEAIIISYMDKKDIEKNKIIGSKLQKSRELCGVSQKELANFCGITKNHISSIERGCHKASVNLLLAYCDKTHMTPDEILNIKEESRVIPELLRVLSNKSPEEQERILRIIKAMDVC